MQAHTRPFACGSAAPRPCSILQAHISATGLRRPLPRRIQQLVHAPSASVGDQLQGLPPSLAKQLTEATASWVEHCLQHPLEDLQTNTKVYVLGTAHFCPNGLDEEILEEVFSVLRPNILAVELPFDTAARAGLPYPPFVQLLCEHLEQQHVSSSLGLSLQGPSMRDLDAPPCDWSQLLNGSPQNMAMVTELLRCAMEARVGRDMFDPFEAYGLYPGLDFVRAPGQALTALQLFGYLPGAEYAHAVSLANAQGIQVGVTASCAKTVCMLLHTCYMACD